VVVVGLRTCHYASFAAQEQIDRMKGNSPAPALHGLQARAQVCYIAL
jgi:hypothetical protein